MILTGTTEVLKWYWQEQLKYSNDIDRSNWSTQMILTGTTEVLKWYWQEQLKYSNDIDRSNWSTQMILRGTTEVLKWKPVLMPLVHHRFHVELPGTEPGSSSWKADDSPLSHGITLRRLKWIHILHQNSFFASNRTEIKADLIRIRGWWNTDWADGVFCGLD